MSRLPSILDSNLESIIHVVRGQRVILDADIANLYGIETKALKRSVRRNKERFPSDFLLELTFGEVAALRYQFGTLEKGRHSKYQTFAFTEQGVAMLSSVLKSRRAIAVNVAIMRAFVRLRQTRSIQKELADQLTKLESRVTGHEKQISTIFEAIRKLIEPPATTRKRIGF